MRNAKWTHANGTWTLITTKGVARVSAPPSLSIGGLWTWVAAPKDSPSSSGVASNRLDALRKARKALSAPRVTAADFFPELYEQGGNSPRLFGTEAWQERGER